MDSIDGGMPVGAAGVSGDGVDGIGASSTTSTVNSAAAMWASADAGISLTSVPSGAADAGGATGAVSAGAGGAGGAGDTYISTSTSSMVSTTDAGTSLTRWTSIHEHKTNGTQATIILTSPMSNLAKELHKTIIDEQCRLASQLHTFLLRDSPDLTQLNDAENKPVAEITTIPKSSTIWVLHSFGVGTNPIGRSYPITGKTLSLSGYGLSANPYQAMVLPKEVFYKTSIWVPNQDVFERKLINTQAFHLLKNANHHQKEITPKAITISSLLVHDSFNTDLEAIKIYRRIKTLDNLNKPATQELFTFLRGCMTSRIVNNTGNFIPYSVFM